jgi:phosphate transport system substrate-binding protein
VAEDSTEAVVAALGNDGIGYAVVSQVQGRDNLRLLTVDGVLPTDARYPYSQPRVYVYNSRNPSPTTLAFLGMVNTPANLADSPADLTTVEATPTPPATPPSANLAEAETPSSGLTSTSSTANPQSVVSEVSPVQPRSWGRQGQSWAWLLAIPLLGGLLWWLLKTQEKPAATAPPLSAIEASIEASVGRLVLVPRHCRRAYAYWEIPDECRAQQRERGGRTLMLRLLDVTHRDVERHPPARIDQFPVTEEQQDLHIPIPTDDRDYQAELGYVSQENHWLPLAKSAPVRVPACATDSTESSPSSALSSAASAPAQASPTILTLDPSHHRIPWDEAQKTALAQAAATHPLTSGTYLIRIQRGQFSYGDPSQPGEPLALLWVDGGPITTPKNQVPTHSLWATLNGYTDALTLAVDNSARLHAFFIDTNPDTNQGQIVLSIQRQEPRS